MPTTPQIEAFAQLGKLWKQVQVDFAESVSIDDPEVLQMVQDLLEEETGNVDRIYDLTIDDADTFQGKAEQRYSLGRSQVLQFTITSDRMTYKLVGDGGVSFGETDEDWAEIIEFAAKSGKKLNCKPGNVQCGGKCQSGSKNCYHGMSPEQKKKAQAAVRKAKRQTKKAEQVKQENKPKSTLPDGVTVDRATMQDENWPHEVNFYNFRVKDSTVDLTVTEGDFYANLAGVKATVDFSVDYSMDRAGAISGRDAVATAIKLRRIMEHDAASRPDGYTYGVVAYSLDGFGARRQQAYEKMGFSAPIRDSRGYQKAVVENGRLKPWNPQ